jgi:hypothetical protein
MLAFVGHDGRRRREGTQPSEAKRRTMRVTVLRPSWRRAEISRLVQRWRRRRSISLTRSAGVALGTWCGRLQPLGCGSAGSTSGPVLLTY